MDGARPPRRYDVRSALWFGRHDALLAGVDLCLDLSRGVRSDHRLSDEERSGSAWASDAGWADVREGRHAADHHGVYVTWIHRAPRRTRPRSSLRVVRRSRVDRRG